MAGTQQGLKLNVYALAAWLGSACALASALGATLTWKYAGTPGLWAQLAAAVLILLVMLASGAWICHRANFGSSRAATAFLAMGFPRIALGIGLAMLARSFFDLPTKPLFVWVGVYYMALLLVEGVWLSRELREIGKGERNLRQNTDTTSRAESQV
jgi:hypothetical protein